MNFNNITSNMDSKFGKEEKFLELLKNFEPYYTLSIVVIGLAGNSLSIVLFLWTKLR